jgi:hypothetical protein
MLAVAAPRGGSTYDMAAARDSVSAQRPHCACYSLAAARLLRIGREMLSWYRHVLWISARERARRWKGTVFGRKLL